MLAAGSMAAIILNGTSSAGKTSIAKAIQKLSEEPFLHISLDSVVDMFRWDAIQGDDLRRECHAVGISNFHKALPILLSSRFPGVIDHVFERDDWYHDCLSALDSHRVLLVGVHCPLEILRSREAARGDRRSGLAEIQFSMVHKNRDYDLEVDTSAKSPEECAAEILAAFQARRHGGAVKTAGTPSRP
jgi:chloramphenicol 3-O phosphotransferase